MQEREYQQPISPERLLSVVEELERGLESLTSAVAQVRSAITLMAASPDVAPPLVLVGEQPDVSLAPPEIQAEAADDEEAEHERARQAVEKAKREASWLSMPVDAGLGFGAKPAPEVHDDDPEAARRAEVRRMVEDARMGVLEADEPAAIDEAAFDNVEVVAAEEPVAEAAIEAILDATIAEAREEIAEAAEEATPEAVDEAADEDSQFSISQAPVADLEADASYEEPVAEAEVIAPEAEDDGEAQRAAEEARREQVRLAVEAAKAEMMGAQAQPEPVLDEDEARREAVRRAVAEARNQMDWGSIKVDSGGAWGQFKPEPGGFTIRPEELAPSAAEMAQSDAASAEAADDAESGDDDEARREAVRRAVEAARAEMFRGEEEEERPRIAPVLSRSGSTAKGADFSGPPLIVIEDAEGRVELSQVFATLSRVNRSSQAALLNYSPHSVTIGLNMLSPVPEARELIEAAQAVFGRECSVKTEGPRTSIEIGSRQLR